mgnify:FL=1
MEHENIDENARYLKACENVKKIVNAIKAIKIKYYTNFAKISEEDKKAYDELETNLEKISEENDLNGLKVALMEEVSAKYDQKELKEEPQNPKVIDKRLLACYGNIDVQQKAISMGQIGKARKCQVILEHYLEEINIEEYRDMVTNYKREKFAELVMERVAVEEKNEEFLNYMKKCFDYGTANERNEAVNKIEKLVERLQVNLVDEQTNEERNEKDTELELQIG